MRRAGRIVAKVLEKTQVIIVGSETPDVVRQMHMVPVSDMDEAFQIAAEMMARSDLDVLIVPHALMTLPIVSETPRPVESSKGGPPRREAF